MFISIPKMHIEVVQN